MLHVSLTLDFKRLMRSRTFSAQKKHNVLDVIYTSVKSLFRHRINHFFFSPGITAVFLICSDAGRDSLEGDLSVTKSNKIKIF